jgi:mono/diheme cytochrome c family protein
VVAATAFADDKPITYEDHVASILKKHCATCHGDGKQEGSLSLINYAGVMKGAGSGEIVIAGPAEPWIVDATGRVRGVETGWPTVLLEDLAAAIRGFAPGQPQDRQIGCSIDPKPEGLAAMQAYLKKVGRVNPKGGTAAIVGGMREALGTQTVSVFGVSPATHFAHVLVEADYRMKLIGIGLEPAPVKMKTWVDLTSGGAGQNALQRWYFLPDYQCVKMAEDDLAIQLVGQGVKLCGADEVVMPDGRRLDANRADGASRTFTQTFTRKYPEIAARNPVYAQLRTLIDLAVVAAYMQEHDAYGKAGWAAETLCSEQAYPVERLTPPTRAETAIHAVWRGNRLLTPIGGGVTVHPRMAIDAPNLIMDEKGEVKTAHAAAKDLPGDAWYWD